MSVPTPNCQPAHRRTAYDTHIHESEQAFANVRDIIARLDRENRQLKSEVTDLQGQKRWLDVQMQMQADRAISCTKLAAMALKDEKLKGRIPSLEAQLEQQRREMQASTETSNSTVADLNRKMEELEQRMREKEKSEKHCHQVVNHLGNLIEVHAGESSDMRGINGACDNLNDVEGEKSVKWLGIEKLR